MTAFDSHLLRSPPSFKARFLDDHLDDHEDFFDDPMSEYFDPQYTTATTSTAKFPPTFRPPASPIYTPTLSSLSSETTSDGESDEVTLPAFDTDDVAEPEPGPATPKASDPLAPLYRTSSDDASIESEPERHVDYLSHDWREEDIWSSWRYVVTRKDRYSNGVRLENASWRTWAKSKYRLRTVSPETLNWLKDCDVTWLYGPLQTDVKSSLPASSQKPPPPSGLSSSNSFLDRKSILKKKTASEAILQRSLSQHTLLKHAGAILQAQNAEHLRGKPSFVRATSDVGVSPTRILDPSFTPSSASSGLISPSERRHIHFNNEVVQCIAVEAKEYEEQDVDPSLFFLGEEYDDDYEGFDEEDEADDTESDEGIVMMKQVSSRTSPSANSYGSSRSTPRSSVSENKIIAPLPPTTLKCRSDTPELPWSQQNKPTNKLSPTPSVETLRPSRPEANFLLDDDDEEQPQADAQWSFNTNGLAYRRGVSSNNNNDNNYYYSRDRPWFVNPEDREELANGNLRLTPSGMFMPYEEGETYTGVFGRIVDTVNTARDIAHVIWNVGWRK